MPAQHVKASERAHEDTSPAKIDVTSKSPVGDISVVTLIRTDTTLDHSQKAEKVCTSVQITTSGLQVASALYATHRAFASGLCQTLRAGSCLHETNTNLVEPVQQTCQNPQTRKSSLMLFTKPKPSARPKNTFSVGNSSQASCLSTNSAMDDSIGDS